MSGQFRLEPTGTPDAVNTRIRFRFTDGGAELRFVDQRMFGGLSLSPGGAELPVEVAHIGLDPFDPHFDLDRAVGALRRKRTGIKRALLDQQLVSGIGNIYADEALWRARTHYARATDTMTRAAAAAVLVPPEARAVGDRWVRDMTSVALRVPSAVVEAEHNLLLNPAHPDFAQVRVGEARPFAFDPRLRGAG